MGLVFNYWIIFKIVLHYYYSKVLKNNALVFWA